MNQLNLGEKELKLPTFLVVGIEKAGTTSIYQYRQDNLC